MLCAIVMTERAARIVDTLIGLDPMSDLPRTGWLLRGIRPCESIADHSYGVAVTVMLLCDALRAAGVEVDGERALRLALVHDVPEAKTGDIPMPQKTAALGEALGELEAKIARSLLPDPSLFVEAAASISLEARLVKAADKIQMMTKALLYERQGRGDLHEFWANERNFGARGFEIAEEIFALLKARHADPSSWELGRV